MNKLLFFTSVFLLLATSYVTAADDVEVSYKGDNYAVLKVNSPEREQWLSRLEPSTALAQSSLLRSRVAASEKGLILVVRNLQGLLDAGLPSWVEKEFLIDLGRSGEWHDVGDSEYETPFPDGPVIIDLELMNRVAIDACNPSSKPEPKNMPFTVDLAATKTLQELGLASNVNTSVYGMVQLNGQVKVDIHYHTRSRCGIPYKMFYQYADIVLDADYKNDAGLLGVTLSSEEKVSLYKHLITALEENKSFWLESGRLDLNLGSSLEIGSEGSTYLDAAKGLEAEVDTFFTMEGKLKLHVRCTYNSCDKVANAEDEALAVFTKLGGKAVSNTYENAKSVIEPYVDIHTDIKAGFYEWLPDDDEELFSVEAKRHSVGERLSMPMMAYYYDGDACSDADNDGTNEYIHTILQDTTAKLDAYTKTIDITNAGKLAQARSLDIKIESTNRSLDAGEWVEVKSGETESYQNNLYFSVEGDDILDVVITPPSPVRLTSTVGFSSRSCYPFSDSSVFEVDWGDNSIEEHRAGRVPHSWGNYGYYTIQAKLLKDDLKREFLSTNTTEKSIYIQSPPQPPTTTPWDQAYLIPIINLVLF